MDYGQLASRAMGIDLTLIGGTWFGLFVLDTLVVVIFAIGHQNRRLRLLPLNLLGLTFFTLGWFPFALIGLEWVKGKPHLAEIVIYMSTYGVLAYIFICEWLMRGGAKTLTKRRGDKWPKEMDYLYISLGAVGLMINVARSDVGIERLSVPQTLGTFLIVTAFAFRFVKTRAEVSEWNRPKRTLDPVGDRICAKELKGRRNVLK